jgi:hypothetical protein
MNSKNLTELISDLNATLDLWITSLEEYSYAQLTTKPGPLRWSIGQVYMHLIADSFFYIGRIKTCLLSNEYSEKEASANGKLMLKNNAFPDEVIDGAPENARVPQPESKEQLRDDLLNLRNEFNTAAEKIAQSPYHGKSMHPGLEYFSAQEWIQFADMHFRHHLRQKNRIDDFLKTKVQP